MQLYKYFLEFTFAKETTLSYFGLYRINFRCLSNRLWYVSKRLCIDTTLYRKDFDLYPNDVGEYNEHCYTSELKYVFRLEENVSHVVGQNSPTP